MAVNNQLKTNLQIRAAQILNSNHRLIARWCTGCGKSSIVIQYINLNPNHGRILIVVPEKNNISNWRDEFKKWDTDDSLVEVCCYASLGKYQGTEWQLLVYDEAPHINTDLKFEYAKTISATDVLALGAVISEDEESTLVDAYGRFSHTEITLDQAINMGLLPPPRICVIHMQMNDDKRHYIVRGKMMTAREKYNYINNKVDLASKDYEFINSSANKQRMLKAGNERKRFLGSQKTDALRYICGNLEQKHKRFICFCSSVAQAHSLGGNKAFTSESPGGMAVLNRFNNHEIDSIYVVGRLIEGQNLNDIEVGVIGQLGGKERITIQSLGRVMRSKSPIVYLPVFDNTKDDSFIYTLTNNISSDYIKHYKLQLKQ